MLLLVYLALVSMVAERLLSNMVSPASIFYFDVTGSPIGFEYWADPSDRSAGYIQWVSDGKPTARLGASAVGPDPVNNPAGASGSGLGGTGIGQRLIPEEPMSIVLNLGISRRWLF